MKTITLKQTGYYVTGMSRILCWDGDVGDIRMDGFHVDSLDEIPDKINDGQFGCRKIISADCDIFEDYEGTHRFLETRHYDENQIGMNAPRGIRAA